MLGLRTQEDSRFEKFFGIVEETAKKKNAVFFLDCGEGRGVFEDEIIYSDCSGWLIPNDKVEEFRAEYEGFKDLSKWEDYVAWETWEKSNGKISVKIELL